MFRNPVGLCSEDLLALCPNCKLNYHPLSAARYCLCNISAATLYTWRSFLRLQHEKAPCYQAYFWNAVCLKNLCLNYLHLSLSKSLHREGRKMKGRMSELSLYYVCQLYICSLLNSTFISVLSLVLLHSKYKSKLKVLLTCDPKLRSETQI